MISDELTWLEIEERIKRADPYICRLDEDDKTLLVFSEMGSLLPDLCNFDGEYYRYYASRPKDVIFLLRTYPNNFEKDEKPKLT